MESMVNVQHIVNLLYVVNIIDSQFWYTFDCVYLTIIYSIQHQILRQLHWPFLILALTESMLIEFKFIGYYTIWSNQNDLVLYNYRSHKIVCNQVILDTGIQILWQINDQTQIKYSYIFKLSYIFAQYLNNNLFKYGHLHLCLCVSHIFIESIFLCSSLQSTYTNSHLAPDRTYDHISSKHVFQDHRTTFTLQLRAG